MKEKIKRLIEFVAPSQLDACRSIKNRYLFHGRFSKLHKNFQKILYQNGPIEILYGPFKGMKYFNEIVWGPITPKWLGCYELELHEVFDEVIRRNYQVIIDVGCAEGYYAVGLAWRIPSAHVFAYDIDFLSRSQTKRLAGLNDVSSRLTIGRYCSHSEISRYAKERTLIICDIEGFERSLIDPISCPALVRCDLVVEIHEGEGSPSMLELIKNRFSGSHQIREFTAESRDKWIHSKMDDSRIARSLTLINEAVNEHRSAQQKWLWISRT